MVDTKAIGMITALVIVISLQTLVVVAHIFSFIPIVVKGPTLVGLEPERESFFYMLFLGTAFLLTLIVTAFVYKKLHSKRFAHKCLKFLCVESVWLGLMLFTFFKWITYAYPFYNILPLENPRWVLPFFYGVVACSVIHGSE